MTARDQFMEGISRALGRTEKPATVPQFTWHHSVHTDVMKDWSQDKLARAFIEYGKTIGIGVYETTKEELGDTIRRALGECGPGSVVVANDPLLSELCAADALEKTRKVRVWKTEDSGENNIHFAEKAAVGIAVAKMALSESATVLLFSHEGCGHSVTLLPESVIYIIPKSRIRPRLTQGMQFLRQNKDRLPSSVNFVSGPSATSDIELVRVVGVHGPVHVVHIVVNDM
jgi:L-lactate dehydrogenase complex protein LldG